MPWWNPWRQSYALTFLSTPDLLIFVFIIFLFILFFIVIFIVILIIQLNIFDVLAFTSHILADVILKMQSNCSTGISIITIQAICFISFECRWEIRWFFLIWVRFLEFYNLLLQLLLRVEFLRFENTIVDVRIHNRSFPGCLVLEFLVRLCLERLRFSTATKSHRWGLHMLKEWCILVVFKLLFLFFVILVFLVFLRLSLLLLREFVVVIIRTRIIVVIVVSFVALVEL